MTILAVALASASCVPASRWQQKTAPRSGEAGVLLESEDPSQLMGEIFPDEVVTIPIRKRLRPCCAFGAQLGAKLGPIPVPFYKLANLRDPKEIGAHTYDSGVLLFRYGDAPELLVNDENNGLVYTCRGGFIDIAHVRDYADWAIYLASEIGRKLGSGFVIDLGEEGGRRRIIVEPVAAEIIEAKGRRRLTVALASRLAFQMSIYHEIATSFGWAAIPGFTELASAFSPEDLYSNLLGVKLASAVIYRRSGASEQLYNRAIDVWLEKLLLHLGAVPRELGIDALHQLDGVWWDSSRRLPDPRLVLRRNLDFEPPLLPWRVPDELASVGLRDTCGGTEPVPLPSPAHLDGIRLDELAHLEIEVPDEWRNQKPWNELGSPVTERDFPVLVAFARELVLRKLGPRSDRPD